jgi:hypothetical protein
MLLRVARADCAARPPSLHKTRQSRPSKKVRLREARRHPIMALEREARGALASSLPDYGAVQVGNRDYEGEYR